MMININIRQQLKMIPKQKFKGLHQPKIVQLTKQQYRKFHTVRKLNSESMGEHELLSCNQKKYISKQLPISCNFHTIRNQNQTIYQYTQDGHNLYIFQLLGEPLCDIWRQRNGQQIRQWTQRCGGMEEALLELIKFCIRIYSQNGIEDILHQCFRVSQGKLYYCYDSWMKGTYEIVSQNNLQIQNYFLSETELFELSKGNFNNSINITYKDYLFKLALFIISLALPQVKIRNYQYCQFSLNKANVQEKLKLFKIKVVNKQLNDLVCKFIHCKIQTMDQIWKILDTNKFRGDSPSTKSITSAQFSHSISRQYFDKQNSILIESRDKNHARKSSGYYRSGGKPLETLNLNQKGANYKKIKLRSKSNVNDSSINMSAIMIQNQQDKNKRGFFLRQSLSKPIQSHSYQKILQYLGLSQYISQSMYQNRIANCLQGIRMKSDWKQKIYQNGSIFLGDIINDKREGKGLYLFQSEDFYFGDWKDNSIHGQGTYVFRSGQSYQGYLRKGLKHGYGRFCYKDGRIYEGHWQENTKFGFGTVIFPNGTKFLGFFQKSNDTYGLFTWHQGQQLYECNGNLQNYNWQTNQFVNTQFDQQVLRNKLKRCKTQSFIPCLKSQGTKYYGESTEGKPDGYGIKQTQTQVYEGNWKNGKQQGQGKLTVKNKFEIKGRWKDGILVQYLCK